MLIHYLQQVELTPVLTNDPFEADHYLAQRVDLSVYEYIRSCMEHSKKVFTDRRMRSESSPTTHLQPHRIMVLSRNRYESIGLRGFPKFINRFLATSDGSERAVRRTKENINFMFFLIYSAIQF
ncbi:NPH3 domain-containing protein [Caenorhabditis elegans]|uniref:NPH3 domain-containing protein n=1 Tax=Caenorhabditis elegans TaxID=6239 RepID=L8E709_CAEEL|nr:NPH3 domain-containing protein [Caenorhabditis elegans]CCQ25703.1 NPH3 domain-containing protein [Caenorhabditis elegans]|eukprot:NP_001263784.1 Uncharacterized protein CELE_R07H5.11 [Caenorhabditis elegans]